jgi:hypothetical protein
MNNVSNKTVLHTLREAPLEAALRTFEQHRATPGAVDTLVTRLLLDARSTQRRVAMLETEMRRMQCSLNATT